MKPFCLEKALAGEPVRCRDESYKLLRLFHAPEVTNEYERLIAIIEADDEIVANPCYEDGSVLGGREHYFDLFMAPKKRTVYINVYSNTLSLAAGVFFTKEDAERRALPGITVATAVPVEIEE